MLFLIFKRQIIKYWSRAPWLTLLALLMLLYAAGYVVMRCTEPHDNPIRSLSTYTYFFAITVTTIGYGDVTPVSWPGRIAAGCIAFGGIGAAAVALGSVFTSVGNFIKMRDKGFLEFAI